MKLTDVFLFIVYGMAAGYVIYFMSYIYNRSTGSVVYNETIPVYSETVVYPWNGGYNWYPYWIGSNSSSINRSSSNRSINHSTNNYKNIGHSRGSYHSGNRPWGSNSGRGANGGGGGDGRGGGRGGGRGDGHGVRG